MASGATTGSFPVALFLSLAHGEFQTMKEIVPQPPAIVRNQMAAIQALFQKNVVPSYGRFNLALSHGAGSYVYDVAGKRYLDLGGGIAVCSLGHSNPEITEALVS